MKIYFCGSIRAGRQDADLYARLIEQLRAYGTVLTEHVGSKELEESERTRTDKDIHDRDVEWLINCDAVVAEVTQPSLGVGYEIGRAVAMDKRILCLFRPSPDKRQIIKLSQEIDRLEYTVKPVYKDHHEDDHKEVSRGRGSLFRGEIVLQNGLSAMISGADNGSTFVVKNYQEDDAPNIFRDFFS